MEVTRRLALVVSLTAALGSTGLSGCYKDPAAHRSVASATVTDPPRERGRDTVAVLMPFHAETSQIRKALVTDLADEFNVVTLRVEANTSVERLAEQLDTAQPRCVVVLENRTVRLYRQLQREAPERTFPPAVVLMTSFLEEVIGTLRDATGIAYEVPAVTGFVAVREIVKTPVQTVGVVHRHAFADVVARQTRLASVEELAIVGREVPDEPSLNEIDDALYGLIHEQGVDALWVLNDNSLLGGDALTEVWLPRLKDKPVPVVVGVSNLVHPDVHFGTLAMLPDHERLGSQAANLIFDIGDNDWKIEDPSVELPLSVRTVVDVAQLRHDFGLQPGALKKVDQALE